MAITISRDAPPWAQRFADDVARELAATRARGFPVVLASFVVADLPDPAAWVGGWIFVSDATGGAVPAYSDGVSWRRPNSTVVD
jgi:hypothetical protein